VHPGIPLRFELFPLLSRHRIRKAKGHKIGSTFLKPMRQRPARALNVFDWVKRYKGHLKRKWNRFETCLV
jgi:hypothetical protein